MTQRIRIIVLPVLLLGLAIVKGDTRAAAQECWWCSSEALEWYEYCDNYWDYKHAFMGAAGGYQGPAHPDYYCGFCTTEHYLCDEDYAAAAARVKTVLASRGDVRSVLAEDSRFARFDAARREIVLRNCKGQVTETLPVSGHQATALLE
jgi:hypothetical protein